jgi:CRISPR-associated exonuclease Cas4
VDDADLIPISALQHYLYCPRQCALIHVERQWAESRHTVEGRLLHERADQPQAQRRKQVRTVTAMPLVSLQLGITGVADVVEFHREGAVERAFPVEYKRGRPKAHRADEVQLCAQALCIEQMMGTSVPSGAVFYGVSRRRKHVCFDEALRALTRQTIVDTRMMIAAAATPSATYDRQRCDACSLIDICQPRWLCRAQNVDGWLKQHLGD